MQKEEIGCDNIMKSHKKTKIYDYITKENKEEQNSDLPQISYILNINNLRLWFLKNKCIT